MNKMLKNLLSNPYI